MFDLFCLYQLDIGIDKLWEKIFRHDSWEIFVLTTFEGCFIYFTLFSMAEDAFMMKRNLFMEKDYEDFLAGLNIIVKPLNLKWKAKRGGCLKSSYFILDISLQENIKHREFNLEREILLEGIRKIFLEHDANIVCFNSDRGIILNREKIFSLRDITSITKKLTSFFKKESEKRNNIDILLPQLETIKNYL